MVMEISPISLKTNMELEFEAFKADFELENALFLGIHFPFWVCVSSTFIIERRLNGLDFSLCSIACLAYQRK